MQKIKNSITVLPELITIIYIVVPYALYVNVIGVLNAVFTKNIFHLREILATILFLLISFIMIKIEILLIDILINKPRSYTALQLTGKIVHTNIFLTSIMSFLIILFLPILSNSKINFSGISVSLTLVYTVFIYFVLKKPLEIALNNARGSLNNLSKFEDMDIT